MNNSSQQLELFSFQSINNKKKIKEKINKSVSNLENIEKTKEKIINAVNNADTLRILQSDGTSYSIPIARTFIFFNLCIMSPILLPILGAMYFKSSNQQEFIIKIIHGYENNHSNALNKKSAENKKITNVPFDKVDFLENNYVMNNNY